MPTFTVYNLEGEKVGTVEQPALFQTEVNQALIHRYFVWVRNALRHTLAHTKTRGEVSGGGRKPWRQKGTGRARVGSSRSPIWRTGGIVFGPRKEQTYNTRMPRTERRQALFSAMSSKALQDKIVILEDWLMETPKTKQVVETMAKLPSQNGKVLHVHSEYTPNLFLSTRNLPNLTSTTVQNMNIIDLLNHEYLLMTKNSLETLEKHFTANL